MLAYRNNPTGFYIIFIFSYFIILFCYNENFYVEFDSGILLQVECYLT